MAIHLYESMNPVRAGLVDRPKDWPYGGEIVYDRTGQPKVIRGGLSLSDHNHGNKPKHEPIKTQ
jgi:hypothetical protein